MVRKNIACFLLFSLANTRSSCLLSGSWCTPYECCFYYSNSCYDSNADECNEHEICSTVFDRLRKKSAMQPSGNVPSSQLSDNELMILARACNGQKVESDDSECRMLCKVRFLTGILAIFYPGANDIYYRVLNAALRVKSATKWMRFARIST